MKITFVLANWVSLAGGVRSNAMLAYHLQKRGHQVYIVSPEKCKPSFSQQMRSLLKGKGWISTKRKGLSHFDGLDVPRRVLEHEPPVTDADVPDADVVVACWWETAEWVANLSETKGAKVYLIRHHEVHDYLPKERSAATYSLPMHKIVISKWLVDLMRTQYGDNNVSLVFNSVDTQKYYAPSRGKQSIPTVGMLYKTTKWKGCDISLKALSLAAQKIPNLRLVAFGLEEPSPDLPLPPGTEYFQSPPQEKIKNIYARCDVWLCGSWGEGFHRPPLEAMACRCPVVSTEVGGPIDRIENGVNGYLVPVGDYTALADRIVRVLNLSDDQWRTMSDAAYTTATSYTWDDAAELCEQAFYTAIERTKRGDFANLDKGKTLCS